MKHVVIDFKDFPWLNLNNNSYHAESIHDISFVDTCFLCSLHSIHCPARVMSCHNCDFTWLCSTLSKSSVSLHVLLSWYIPETWDQIVHTYPLIWSHTWCLYVKQHSALYSCTAIDESRILNAGYVSDVIAIAVATGDGLAGPVEGWSSHMQNSSELHSSFSSSNEAAETTT